MRRAAALAVAAVMTGGAAIVRLRQNRRAPDRDAAVGPALLDGALQQALAADHLHAGQKVAVGQLRQSFRRAADTDEGFDLVVVRRNLGVADRPIVAVAIVRGGFEIIIRKPVALATPHNRAPADLPTTYPIKRLVRRRRVRIGDV